MAGLEFRHAVLCELGWVGFVDVLQQIPNAATARVTFTKGYKVHVEQVASGLHYGRLPNENLHLCTTLFCFARCRFISKKAASILSNTFRGGS